MTDETEPDQRIAALDRNNEPISALVDGELDPKGADFLIRRLVDDEQMHQHWQRFHMVRACLQREFAGPVSLVDRIRTELENEVTPESTGRISSLMRLGFGGAIAASVALVAVMGLANRMGTEEAPGAQQDERPGFVSQSTALDRQFNAQAIPAGFGGNRDTGSADSNELRGQQRSNRYMIRHSQATGSNGFNSLTPILAAPSAVHLGRPAQERSEQQQVQQQDQDSSK